MAKVMWLVIAVVLWCGSSPLYAQQTVVDFTKAKFVWTWAKGQGGDVKLWRVRCGSTPGAYANFADLADPAARSWPISQVIPGEGTYFCVLEAVNDGGSSGPTPELSFQAVKVPVKPLGFTLSPQ